MVECRPVVVVGCRLVGAVVGCLLVGAVGGCLLVGAVECLLVAVAVECLLVEGVVGCQSLVEVEGLVEVVDPVAGVVLLVETTHSVWVHTSQVQVGVTAGLVVRTLYTIDVLSVL